MPNDPTPAAGLFPASQEEVAAALCTAMTPSTRRDVDAQTTIVAERLVEHLRRSGFVLMKPRPGIG